MYQSFLVTSLAAIASAAVHTIDVGENGFKFEPETIDNVQQGDILIFHLYPRHNVVQGAFDSPCTPSDGGFYSGPFSETDDGKKKFVVNVTSNDPVYWYCSVEKHCENGMVGGANIPSSGNTIEAYKDAAKSVAQSETPNQPSGGELLEDEQISKLTQGGDDSSTTESPSASSSSSSPSETAASTTATATPSVSGSDAAAAPSTTGAANAVRGSVRDATGVLGLFLAVFAWFM